MPGATEAFTVAGATVSICEDAPASITKTAYAALDYEKIGMVSDPGQVGRVYQVNNFLPVDARGAIKKKGSYDDGTVTVQVGFAPGDAGQALAREALDEDEWYSFELALQDGTKVFYQAQVTGFPIATGGADNYVMAPLTLAVKSGSIVVAVPA